MERIPQKAKVAIKGEGCHIGILGSIEFSYRAKPKGSAMTKLSRVQRTLASVEGEEGKAHVQTGLDTPVTSSDDKACQIGR